MQKMHIKLDEQKVKRVGKYNTKELWRRIDEIFTEHSCTVAVQSDGAHEYLTDRIQPEKQMAQLALCYEVLCEQAWFASSVEQWIWYESENAICDVLEEEIAENQFFKRAYAV